MTRKMDFFQDCYRHFHISEYVHLYLSYSRNGGNGRRQRMTSGHAEDTNFNIRLFVHLSAGGEECDMIGDT